LDNLKEEEWMMVHINYGKKITKSTINTKKDREDK
jgi:hypothetical protein